MADWLCVATAWSASSSDRRPAVLRKSFALFRHSVDRSRRGRGWVAFEIPSTAIIERVQFLTGHPTTKMAEFLLEA